MKNYHLNYLPVLTIIFYLFSLPASAQTGDGEQDINSDISNTQVVFLNFDSVGLPTFPVSVDRASILPDYVFSQDERDEIQQGIESIYSGFKIVFTQQKPSNGEYSTIFFNDNDDRFNSVGVSDGAAEAIDFRNINKSDIAFVDTAKLVILREKTIQSKAESSPDDKFDFAAFNFNQSTGFVLSDDVDASISKAIVAFCINVGSHELGHILGLRHHDALGPIGSGAANLIGRNSTRADNFVPAYQGPADAINTQFNIMVEGQGSSDVIKSLKALSQRSAIKLSANEQITPVNEESSALNRAPQHIILQDLRIPQTISEKEDTNSNLSTRAAIITGSLTDNSEVDFYFFDARADDIVTIEAVSNVLKRLNEAKDSVITRLALSYFDQNLGELQPVSQNFQGPEGRDPLLLDARLPFDGIYVIEVFSSDEIFLRENGTLVPVSLEQNRLDFLRTGSYELYLYLLTDTNEASIPLP